MQGGFTSPDGFIPISYPDTPVPRPSAPLAQSFFVGRLSAEVTDINMGWMPSYPVPIHQLRPVHPNWVGVDIAAVINPSIAPLSWAPILLSFLSAPRLHRVFPAFNADPLSGDMMATAQRMAWNPQVEAPLQMRPRLKTGGYALVIPTTVIAAAETCVHLVDTNFTVPDLTGIAQTVPRLIDEAFTIPDLIGEVLC